MLIAKAAAHHFAYSEWQRYRDIRKWEQFLEELEQLWSQAFRLTEDNEGLLVETSNYDAAAVLLKALGKEDKTYRKFDNHARRLMLEFMEKYIRQHPEASDFLSHVSIMPQGSTDEFEEAVQSRKGY